MQVTREQRTPTRIKLTVISDESELAEARSHVLKSMGANVKVQGFRPGKAPAQLVEKQLDQSLFQAEFLEHAVNDLYVAAVQQTLLRPVAQPEIAISKFVPFTTLEFSAEFDSVGDITLPDYKKITVPLEPVLVTAKEVNDVLDNLKTRASVRKDVTRAAKVGDEVVIDFAGVDAKTKEPIAGADGASYPLLLGSNSFIPGFEDELVGLKPDAEKTFTITFPKNYSVSTLQSRKVSFTVTIKKVQALEAPKLDDAFAATVGPFKTLTELKTDIKKQLEVDQAQQHKRAYENRLLEAIATKSTVAIPPSLVEEEIDRLEAEEKRNIVYRGQTWQEHLDEEAVTEEAHRERQRSGAEIRVKAGLILGEISEIEKIQVTPDELEVRIQLLKGQYTDPTMQAELDKPENRRDIASRLVSEKTIERLSSLSKK